MSAHQLDIRGEVCPMTWVRLKLKLEALHDGEELEVVFIGAEPLKNLPVNVRDEGHEVLSCEPINGEHHLRIRVRAP